MYVCNYVCTCMYVHVHTYVRMYVIMYMYVQYVHVLVCMYYVSMYVCMYMYVLVYMYVCTCTCVVLCFIRLSTHQRNPNLINHLPQLYTLHLSPPFTCQCHTHTSIQPHQQLQQKVLLLQLPVVTHQAQEEG